MAELKNEFTWSASRHGSFAYCKRQYWWSYYGSWGGWERHAPAEAREAYMLKNLSSRWAWVGTAVHEQIERILKRIPAELREDVTHTLRVLIEAIDDPDAARAQAELAIHR